MNLTTKPGQSQPPGISQPVAPTTPMTEVRGNAADAAQLARHFHTSPVAWNAHLTAGNPALNPTNSSSGAVSSSSRNTATQTTPDWVRDLPEGTLRGDECFRARYGNHVSLLESDGRTDTGFTSDPSRCPVHLRLSAETLAAYMQIRNGVVAELLGADAALHAAQAHLLAEQQQLETAQQTASRDPLQPGGLDFFALQKNAAAARESRDAAQSKRDELQGGLNNAQNDLKNQHDVAKVQVALSEQDLMQQQVIDGILRRHLESFEPENSTLSVYAVGLMWAWMANAVATTQDYHVSRLVNVVLSLLGEPTEADQLLNAILHGVGFGSGVLGDSVNRVQASMESEFTRDVACSLLIGLVLAHMLVKSGWLDG